MSDYVQEQFDGLASTINRLNMFKSEARSAFEARYKAILDYHDQLPSWSFQKEEGRPYFIHYQSPSTAVDLVVPPAKNALSDQIEFNALQRLKTYHWLLVEAYESFVKFLGNVYAYCGIQGMPLWQRPEKWKKDGSLKIDDYNTGDKPYGQLRAFREGCQHFRLNESQGPTGRDYRLQFVVMEKLRHTIVHNGGYCIDFKRLIDKMQAELKAMDLRKVREYTLAHFTPHANYELIDLLEISEFDADGNPTGAYKDIMMGFFRMVIEYAYLIIEAIRLQGKAMTEVVE
jgi:hypothetical protein